MRKFKEFELRKMKIIHEYVNFGGNTIVTLVMYSDNIQFIGNNDLTYRVSKLEFFEKLFCFETHGRNNTHTIIIYVDRSR